MVDEPAAPVSPERLAEVVAELAEPERVHLVVRCVSCQWAKMGEPEQVAAMAADHAYWTHLPPVLFEYGVYGRDG